MEDEAASRTHPQLVTTRGEEDGRTCEECYVMDTRGSPSISPPVCPFICIFVCLSIPNFLVVNSSVFFFPSVSLRLPVSNYKRLFLCICFSVCLALSVSLSLTLTRTHAVTYPVSQFIFQTTETKMGSCSASLIPGLQLLVREENMTTSVTWERVEVQHVYCHQEAKVTSIWAWRQRSGRDR